MKQKAKLKARASKPASEEGNVIICDPLNKVHIQYSVWSRQYGDLRKPLHSLAGQWYFSLMWYRQLCIHHTVWGLNSFPPLITLFGGSIPPSTSTLLSGFNQMWLLEGITQQFLSLTGVAAVQSVGKKRKRKETLESAVRGKRRLEDINGDCGSDCGSASGSEEEGVESGNEEESPQTKDPTASEGGESGIIIPCSVMVIVKLSWQLVVLPRCVQRGCLPLNVASPLWQARCQRRRWRPLPKWALQRWWRYNIAPSHLFSKAGKAELGREAYLLECCCCCCCLQGFDGCSPYRKWQDTGLSHTCSWTSIQAQFHAKKW